MTNLDGCNCAGDKERSFVGSREWIGAIELGYVLDSHVGVTCKIVTVASGADMPSKAREIAHHFDTQVKRPAPPLPALLLPLPLSFMAVRR